MLITFLILFAFVCGGLFGFYLCREMQKQKNRQEIRVMLEKASTPSLMEEIEKRNQQTKQSFYR